MSQLTPDATTPSQPLLHTPLMTETEQQLVLQDFNSTQHTYDPSTLAHQLFAQHAAKNPDKPCVIFDGRHYTYAEVCITVATSSGARWTGVMP
jgi:non-ribosomal peptide synthetase component F